MIVSIKVSERVMEREWTIFSVTTPVKSREAAGEIFLEMKRFRDKVEEEAEAQKSLSETLIVSTVKELVVQRGRVKSMGFELRKPTDEVFDEKLLIKRVAKKMGIRVE